MTPARSKERKYPIFKQYWYTKIVPVFTNTGMFQYLGPEVYFFPISYHSLLLPILASRGLETRVVLTVKRLRACVAGKTPFHAPSAAPQDPLFSIFQFHKTPIITIFFQNFRVQNAKCGNLSVPKPKYRPESSFGSLIWAIN